MKRRIPTIDEFINEAKWTKDMEEFLTEGYKVYPIGQAPKWLNLNNNKLFLQLEFLNKDNTFEWIEVPMYGYGKPPYTDNDIKDAGERLISNHEKYYGNSNHEKFTGRYMTKDDFNSSGISIKKLNVSKDHKNIKTVKE